MSKMMVDKISIGGSPVTDIVLSVKGSVIIDKDTEDELTKGVGYISGEKIELSVETVDEPISKYNSLRGLFNTDVTATFFYQNAPLFGAKAIRIYAKITFEAGQVPKMVITGGKKFATSSTITDHAIFPS